MKAHAKVLWVTFASLISGAAVADGRSAAHNLFSNLARAKASIGVDEKSSSVGPTLVKGVYVLTDRQGRFVGFTNEQGTLFGDSQGFNVVSQDGAQPRPIMPAEKRQLQTEVIAAVDYDKLPRLSYGDGGGRRLLMFSAVDCGFCKGFEDSMRKHASVLNSTIYVVPSSLQRLSQGGVQAWGNVSRIWCDARPGEAWQAYWASRAVPAQQQCAFADPRVAEKAEQHLRDIFQATGMRVTGTPRIVREDGTLIGNKPGMDATYISATFGPSGAPNVAAGPGRWLTSSDASFTAQPVGGAPNTQQAQAKTSFNSNDLLRKIIGK